MEKGAERMIKLTNKITALYIRVSTEAQKEEGYSIEAQVDKLKAFCIIKEYEAYKIYIDGGFSGSNMERPELQRLIKDIDNSLIDRVVVYKLDRLSRSLRDTMHMIEDILLPNNVDFVSLTENLDTSTPLGRAMIAILSAFAQLERENIKERMLMGNVQRVKNGYWKGGNCKPFGYDYDKEKGILVKNADAEKVVQIYNLYLEGYSARKIADMLGIKNEQMVHNSLGRKTYTGLFEYRGITYDSKNEIIIDRETFKRVLEMKKKRATTHEAGVNLFTGIIFCGNCEARMRHKTSHRWQGLQCYSKAGSHKHMIKDPNCQNKSIKLAAFEKAVLDDLFSITTTPVEIKDDTQPLNTVDIVEILTQQHEEAAKQLKKLYFLYSSGSDEMLVKSIEETRERMQFLQNQISEEKKKVETVPNYMENYAAELETIESAWEHMTDKEKRDVIRLFIKKIVMTDGKIKVYYNFTRKPDNG